MSIIEVEHLRKRYSDTVAVSDVSFTIEEGEIFGILGPNGAGKTTTVESISGLRKPDHGRISVLGLDPTRDRSELRRVLGVQLQESGLPEKLKVGEALDLYASFYADPADPGQLIDALDLSDKRDAVRKGERRPAAATVDFPGADRPAADRRARRAYDRTRPAGAT